MDPYVLAERGTALLWVLLAVAGVFRRLRRIGRLNQIVLPEPYEQEDLDYLASVKRSTYLRLGVKCVLLLGGLIALFQATEYLLIWRVGVIVALALMDFETVNVDAVRRRLALRARALSDEQAQRDRIEATGQDTNERIRAATSGDEIT